MTVEIWHNPRCSKSRDGLALLKEKELDPKVFLYMKTPPTRMQLQKVLADLKMSPGDLVRRGEEAFNAHFLQNSRLEVLRSITDA